MEREETLTNQRRKLSTPNAPNKINKFITNIKKTALLFVVVPFFYLINKIFFIKIFLTKFFFNKLIFLYFLFGKCSWIMNKHGKMNSLN